MERTIWIHGGKRAGVVIVEKAEVLQNLEYTHDLTEKYWFRMLKNRKFEVRSCFRIDSNVPAILKYVTFKPSMIGKLCKFNIKSIITA